MSNEFLSIAKVAKEASLKISEVKYEIKNIALNAIFKAVSEDSPVTMKHILLAMKNENTKNGDMFFAGKYGAYASLLTE